MRVVTLDLPTPSSSAQISLWQSSSGNLCIRVEHMATHTVLSPGHRMLCSCPERWHPSRAWPAPPSIITLQRARRQSRHAALNGHRMPRTGSLRRRIVAASVVSAATATSSPVAEWLFVAGTLYTLPFFLLVSGWIAVTVFCYTWGRFLVQPSMWDGKQIRLCHE